MNLNTSRQSLVDYMAQPSGCFEPIDPPEDRPASHRRECRGQTYCDTCESHAAIGAKAPTHRAGEL